MPWYLKILYFCLINQESSLKRLLLIFSGFLPRTLKGEAAENQPPFRDGAKLIFGGCEKCVFLDWPQSNKTIMKKLFLPLLLLFILPSMALSSNHAQLFSYDKEAVEATFSGLNELEEQVLSYSENVEGLYFATVDLTGFNKPVGAASPLFSISEMDWGAFAWGFCCCPVGLFTVVFNDDKSKASKTSYWIGVGVNFAFNIIMAILNAMLGVMSSATTI